MTFRLLYWIIMLIWLLFGLGWHFALASTVVMVGGFGLALFILLVLLGWKVFGPPLQP